MDMNRQSQLLACNCGAATTTPASEDDGSPHVHHPDCATRLQPKLSRIHVHTDHQMSWLSTDDNTMLTPAQLAEVVAHWNLYHTHIPATYLDLETGDVYDC